MDWFEKNKDTKGDNKINPKKVELLKEICDKTGAEIVLSSTWRNIPENPSFLYLVDLLRDNGLEIKSFTPKLEQNRPREIKAWLGKHKDEEIESFVSLDDDFSEGHYKEYGIEGCLVKTSFYGEDGGLQRKHVEKAIKILNK